MNRLEEIVAHCRTTLVAQAGAIDLVTLEHEARARPPARSLLDALRRPGIHVIAEVKLRSPSAGVIARDIDPVEQAVRYVEGGASAISVLTNEEYFGGKIEHLAAIADDPRVTVPVLRKDFIVERSQLVEARAAGADAVLLIVAVLDERTLRDLLEHARGLGMDALVEAHTPQEVVLAQQCGARIIGINSRDLTDFTIDATTIDRCAGVADPETVLVAESGIVGRATSVPAVAAGARALLVGSALMKASDPSQLIGELRGDRSHHRSTRVKLCGIRSVHAARAAVAAGADSIGVICTESRRRVTVDMARAIVSAARDARAEDLRPVTVVGVFVDEDRQHIAVTVADAGLDAVQVPAGHVIACNPDARVTPMTIVTVGVAPGEDAGRVIRDVRDRGLATEADVIHVDTVMPGLAGGTGHAFDWASLPHQRVPLQLAGGLTPECVGAAIASVAPDIVDVSSGIEESSVTSPGRMAQFIDAVEAHDRRSATPEAPHLPARAGHDPLVRGRSSSQWQVDDAGRFASGSGGRYVPETLMPAAIRLALEWERARSDPGFRSDLEHLFRSYIGRPTPLQRAGRLTEHVGGATIWLKREDLCHTGAHKINNAIGQVLLARRMGATRIIAETGAGQHGVATATACALFGLPCIVYMGEEDTRRQEPNVFRMQVLGAEVHPVTTGTRTLKDATNVAIRDWVTNVESTFYVIGSAVGMHPYPTMVRDLQCCIGLEIRDQAAEEGIDIDAVVACVGGGSNSIGSFHPFLDDSSVRLLGAEGGGHGVASGEHAAAIVGGEDGVLHGARTLVMHDQDGQIRSTHSISAGLDYPAVGPEHAHLHATGRATYTAVEDDTALDAVRVLCAMEGIIPALESAHAIALGMEEAATLSADRHIVITVSGRGDKDLATYIDRLGAEDVHGS